MAYKFNPENISIIIKSPFGGPPINDRLNPQTFINALDDSGFLNIEYENIGDYFYSIIAIKKYPVSGNTFFITTY